MPSEHSSSSHSGSSGGSYSSGSSYTGGDSYSNSYRDYYGNPRLSDEDIFMTVRRSKPKVRASKPAKGYYSFRCICGKEHDYRLFESDWKDKNRIEHKAGWYDEHNNRYDAAAFEGFTGATCICGNCGQSSSLDIRDQSVTQYECPNCHYIVKVAIEKEDEVKALTSLGKEYFGSIKFKIFCAVLAALIVFGSMVGIPNIPAINEKQITQESTKELGLRLKNVGNDRYVCTKSASPDKTLVWDGENYHDTELDLYVWYNESAEQYQYWYKPISEHYGDYGWMEYDSVDGHWYIEKENGKWIVVPDEYDTSKLYHIEDSKINSIIEAIFID